MPNRDTVFTRKAIFKAEMDQSVLYARPHESRRYGYVKSRRCNDLQRAIEAGMPLAIPAVPCGVGADHEANDLRVDDRDVRAGRDGVGAARRRTEAVDARKFDAWKFVDACLDDDARIVESRVFVTRRLDTPRQLVDSWWFVDARRFVARVDAARQLCEVRYDPWQWSWFDEDHEDER
jgi:hypothetical protein